MINIKNILKSLSCIEKTPFDHVVIDNFFHHNCALQLEKEFPNYHSNEWYVYENAIENKKALNNWNIFPPLTFRIFTFLNSDYFTKLLSLYFKENLKSDYGLHGGGWHIHGAGGNLNPHLDYSIHPKSGLQRKLNIIIYLSSNLIPDLHGGHLGFWSHDEQRNQPKEVCKEVAPIFNRAVIFDTTQNSWHGMSQKLTLSSNSNIFRKSLAIYYLIDPSPNSKKNLRALFAPRDEQKGDKKIIDLINKRQDIVNSMEVYKSKNNE